MLCTSANRSQMLKIILEASPTSGTYSFLARPDINGHVPTFTTIIPRSSHLTRLKRLSRVQRRIAALIGTAWIVLVLFAAAPAVDHSLFFFPASRRSLILTLHLLKPPSLIQLLSPVYQWHIHKSQASFRPKHQKRRPDSGAFLNATTIPSSDTRSDQR